MQVPGGLPLGVSASGTSPYPVSELRLSPHATLLLCTDGLIESRDADIDTGILQVQDLLDKEPHDLDAMARRIVSAVERRRAQADDIGVLRAALPRADTSAATRGPATTMELSDRFRVA